MANNSAEQKLAEHLAAPFALPGRTTKPLSFRLLPEGGMVVISADGRKLWFSLEEANTARQELGIPQVIIKKKVVEIEKEEFNPNISSRPSGGSRDGLSELIVLPPDLKHLERKVNDKPRRY